MTTITTHIIQTTSTDNNSKTSSQRYKTELCRSYHETGFCKYGEKCQFAHGYHEIRSLNRHPKYKTILCRTYHCTGYCKYHPPNKEISINFLCFSKVLMVHDVILCMMNVPILHHPAIQSLHHHHLVVIFVHQYHHLDQFHQWIHH
jgi:hypothetical protein